MPDAEAGVDDIAGEEAWRAVSSGEKNRLVRIDVANIIPFGESLCLCMIVFFFVCIFGLFLCVFGCFFVSLFFFCFVFFFCFWNFFLVLFFLCFSIYPFCVFLVLDTRKIRLGIHSSFINSSFTTSS